VSQNEPTRYSGFSSNVRDRSQRGQEEPGDGGSNVTRTLPAPPSTENRTRAGLHDEVPHHRGRALGTAVGPGGAHGRRVRRAARPFRQERVASCEPHERVVDVQAPRSVPAT
jgi:hypothetical protein